MPPGIESISTVFTYFNPTRSPYYTVGLASCVALFFACDVQSRGQWLWVAVPVYLVTIITLVLSIDSSNSLTESEHAEQLRFARSTSISVAVLSLSLAGRVIAASSTPNRIRNFDIDVAICCVQIALFLLYSWGLNRRELPRADRNYVQITLLTSAFLGDTCWNLAQATDSGDIGAGHHQLTAYGLGFLWATCVVFWAVKLRQLRIIQVQRLAPDPVLAPNQNPEPQKI